MRRLVCHLIDANVDTAFFRSIARHQDRERFPVMIGSVAPPGPLQEAMTRLGTSTFALGATKRWQYPAAVARLAKLLRRNRAALLHAHCFDPTFLGLLAARLAGVPFVFTRHHSDHNSRLGKKWHTRIDAWCARHADGVIAVSEATRRILVEIEGVPGGHIRVVHNGMEPMRQPTAADQTRLREELGLDGKLVLLTVARLHEEKGHRFLFDALSHITACVGPVSVLLAGDGPHRRQLQEDVRCRGFDRTVRFLGKREDVPGLLDLASVFVLPSLAESFGFVLVEAMSQGVPVVATTTGGIPEVVLDGQTGLLVGPGDAPALAKAVCRVLADRAYAARLGAAGRRQAERFTFERMIRGYETFYQQIV